jgi:hypothetical protein
MRKRQARRSATPYYPSQQRGHQMLLLDDRTVIGRLTR